MAHFDDTLEPIGFTVDSGDGAGCPCPPHPPCPPPFPPPAPKPSAVDDNVPYNPATFADLCKVRMEIVTEAMERINYDKYLSSEIAKLTPGGRIDVDDHLSLTSTNPVQNKVITETLIDIDEDIEALSSDIAVLSGDVATLKEGASTQADQIALLSSELSRVEGKIDALSGWCQDEFVKDEFTDFMDVNIHKEIRGGYSDEDILLIGSKGDGLHYMLPGDVLPSKCQCPSGQEEFDKYQFRNIIKGNGCYVATNRDAVNRTNIYTSVDGVTWEKKEHTLKHVETNGNVCYSDVSHKYYHATLASEYPELSSTGNCVEVSDDLENWSVLTLADDRKIIGTYGYASVLCAGNYLYITTIGGNGATTRWYIAVDLTTNLVHKEGDEIFHGYNMANGWMRWVDGNRIYIGCSQSGVNYSDRIITTADGFDTFDEYVINPGNKLGFDFPSSYKSLIIRSMTKYNGIYYIGTYETASPHILMSYDLKYWHVVSTPVQGIGADMLCPFQDKLYVGYSGDLSEATGTALMADVRYTYHTDHLVINGILNDLEKGGTGGGGSLAKVEKINVPYNDKIVRAKVNEIIVALGGTIDRIPEEFTDDDIKETVNQIIDKYS